MNELTHFVKKSDGAVENTNYDGYKQFASQRAINKRIGELGDKVSEIESILKQILEKVSKD